MYILVSIIRLFIIEKKKKNEITVSNSFTKSTLMHEV